MLPITQTCNQVYTYLAALVFVASSVAATNYFLNDFYVVGAAMADSGWYAYVFAHSLNWPPLNPPSIGGNYFQSSHFSPILFVFASVHAALGLVGAHVPAPVYFSVAQGALVGCLPLAIFWLLASGECRTTGYLLMASILAITSGFGAASLAALFLPHIEIGISVCLLLFFALYCNSCNRLAILPLAAGLFIREDAGLHYFGFFLTLAWALYVSKSKLARIAAKEMLALALCSLAYALAVIIAQHLFFTQNDALARVYTGRPPYQHLTMTFLKGRVYFMLHYRMYILAPLGLLALIALTMRDWILLVGAVAVLPWLVFSVGAISFQAGTLTYYYAFPMVISMSWPAVSYRMARLTGVLNRRMLYASCLLLLAISSLIFVRQIPPDAPVAIPGFGFNWYGKVANNQSALRRFLSKNVPYQFVVDDAVASLDTESVTQNQWHYAMTFSSASLGAADGVIFQPGAWLAQTAERIASEARFVYRCKVIKSNFVVLSRRRELAECVY